MTSNKLLFSFFPSVLFYASSINLLIYILPFPVVLSLIVYSYIENDEGYVNVRDGTLGLSAEDEAIVAAMNSGPMR
mgnify:FL=1